MSNKEIHVTIYTKEKGILEFSKQEWFYFRPSIVTLHRDNGPAFEFSSGSREWWREGKLHRDDGPALEYNGIKTWYINGDKHRLDGPAVLVSYPYNEEYHIDGVLILKCKFDALISEMKSLGPSLGLIDPRWWVRDYWKNKLKDPTF